MYKTIAIIVATLLVANTLAITDCVVESTTPAKCYVCKLGKAPAAADQLTCTDVAGDCQIPALATINGLNLCDLCKDGKNPTATGTCVANTSAITLGANCGLAYASATAWTCVGCMLPANDDTKIIRLDGANCAQTTFNSTSDGEALVTGLTSKTCPANYKNLGTNVDKCVDYKTITGREPENTAKHIQYYDNNGQTTDGIAAYYSSDKSVTAVGVIVAGVTDCWIVGTTTTECLKCRWGKLTTYQAKADGVKVTCAAAETGASATVSKCVAKIIPTVAGLAADAKCHLCAYLNGTLAAVNSTFICPDGTVAGGNNNTNNTSNPTTTSSSILSLSFAAFLILIINRLF